MRFRVRFFDHRNTVICLLSLAAVTAALVLPIQRRATASAGLFERSASHTPDLPNYDIRTDKTNIEKLVELRSALGRDGSSVAALRTNFKLGEAALRQSVPTLKVDYNDDIRTPEVIGPDVKQGRAFLTAPSQMTRSGVLRDFLHRNAALVGLNDPQIDELKLAADYTNPDGDLSFVEFDQNVNGIPVFRGEVKAGFTKRGEMIRVINNLAAGLDDSTVSAGFGDPITAAQLAAKFIYVDASKLSLNVNESDSTANKVVLGRGDSATTAEKIYFPTEPGIAIPAWRVLIWRPVNAYYVIVDAVNGTLLWRKDLTEDQTQSATYSVYTNPNAMINVAHSPFPFSPGPTSPNGAQGSAIARTGVTRVGNEPPYTFNNLGWIPDGGTVTDGNAVQAGLDRDGVDGVDANSEASSPTRNFTFAYNPFDPNTLSGDAPLPVTQTYPGSVYQQGIATQLFYICNWYHDEAYRLGFNEQARNFQNDNFGRGGVAGDRVRGEGQDSSGTNNANFSTAADGVRGRMQMYIFTGPDPDIDGSLDADVVVHEHTHGLSNRLHGDASGLSVNMSRGLGEGWSDFYGLSMLSQASDPINGIYTTGAYATYNFQGLSFNNNAYYGIRRFPYAIRSSTGGPGNLPFNPETFADIDGSKINLSDGAYSQGPIGSGNADEVHNAGEIWCSALWEVRARLVSRLGWAVGNRKALQIVTDGMKLAPLAPTFISERDAILAAAQASSLSPDAASDVSDVWAGFAIRGIGYSASIQNQGTGVGDARVTESFDLPNLFQTPGVTISDAAGNNNGFPDPGEHLSINIPLTNSTGNQANGVTLQIVGGGSANYGNISSGSTVTQAVPFTVPAGAACGSLITLTLNVNSNLGATSFTRTFAVGAPVVTASENFDGVTAPSLPAGWVVTSRYAPMTFANVFGGADSAPNSMFAADLPNCTTSCTATDGGDTDLTSPPFAITHAAATVSFRQKYNTEPGWDGGVLEISIAGGAFQDILAAGGTFIQNGYNASMGVSSPNPLGGRNGWTGDSGGYLTTIVRLPSSAAGQTVQLRWRFGADNNGAPAGGGWNIDSVAVSGMFSCTIVDNFHHARADFDGDGKTDISVVRPATGTWYELRSQAGFTAFNWGLSTDIAAPGDFDGDGKADAAVFRPSTGTWYILQSSNGTVDTINFGLTGDIPVAADYDGDSKSDIAVFRPSTGVWYVLKSTGGTNTVPFGTNGDRPVRGDFDGDGKADMAIYRSGQWWINKSSGGITVTSFGLSSDLPVNADYDGDGRDDIAVFRPSDGVWYRLNSGNGQFAATAFGLNGDIPVPGDYDGDGKDDLAVYRNGVWYVNGSLTGFSASSFGLASDIPTPAKYIP